MMRNKTSSSMQKTYDECYLVCSTAVYFEGQNNEAEALRSWRSALDQIYYHNAYRVPPNYRPKTETERALQESLKEMEIQCKERVDLLEALRQSRAEVQDRKDEISNVASTRGISTLQKPPNDTTNNEPSGWIGEGTIPAVSYPDLSRPGPPLPRRPVMSQQKSSESQINRLVKGLPGDVPGSSSPYSTPTLPKPPQHISRTPSPEKRKPMLTTLRPGKDGKRPSKSRESSGRRSGAPTASKAAGLAWDSISRSSGQKIAQPLGTQNSSATTLSSSGRNSFGDNSGPKRESLNPTQGDLASRSNSFVGTRSGQDLSVTKELPRPSSYHERLVDPVYQPTTSRPETIDDLISLEPLKPSVTKPEMEERGTPHNTKPLANQSKAQPNYLTYRSEYPPPQPVSKPGSQVPLAKLSKTSDAPHSTFLPQRQRSPQRKPRPPPPPIAARRPVADITSPRRSRPRKDTNHMKTSSESGDEDVSRNREEKIEKGKVSRNSKSGSGTAESSTTPPSSDRDSPEVSPVSNLWEERVTYVKKHLPKGVDENAAKQIFNEIVVHGDEVNWDDVAGLDAAKSALKEAVVYPFLRPDLFMGLREPARGMLLFGPPGTGKTMLARAVATESRSTFFAISASSLTSKFLGESEKLVRALFALARALAPSIIFVDEIDSLLSSRGGSSEHEATRRIKTEFLIQWSDLQRAAAGKEQTEKEKRQGDASRVLVLAATNLPWAIDEAARRRFVRRQYIPLPEGRVRAEQLMRLLGHQKHELNKQDIQVLVELTDGYSGSDITALAKDAAMGPLRSLGEALLSMTMDEIRPIRFEDFEASLVNIRPSVSKEGLKEFENWARNFGERGG